MSRTGRLVHCATLALTILATVAAPSHGYKMNQSGNGWSTSGSRVACDATAGFGHWNIRNISFHHNTSGSGADKAQALQFAMDAWTDVTEADYALSYGGTTDARFSHDSLNTLSWGTDPVCDSLSCHAITALVVQSGQVIIESDVLFNDNPALHLDWRTDGVSDPCTPVNPGNRIDTQGVATHELGHSLGIHHPSASEPSFSTATMGAVSCSSAARSLESDDRDALKCSEDRYPWGPAYGGSLEVATCRSISGWAWNADRPNRPSYVEIRNGLTLLKVLPAGTCRADLLNAGIGNGCHGFSYIPSLAASNQAHSISVRHTGTGAHLPSSPQSVFCGIWIFTTQTPVESLDTMGQVYTVGTRFSSNRNGYIRRLRFWKAPGEGGANTLRLYTDSGVELASTACSGGSSGGWCTGTLPGTGVAITAGTFYRVTVNTNLKQSKTGCGIGGGISNGPLTATHGYWIAGAAFPTNQSCSNFFVDAQFDM